MRERIRYEEILRAANEEAERARVAAERASNAKSEFLSRVSHELRTPLNAILGFGQLLELDDLSSRQSQKVEHILRGGRHLLGLVNEVLDLASIESGKMELVPEDIEVGPLLRETIDLVGPLARARAVSFHLDPGATGEAVYIRPFGRGVLYRARLAGLGRGDAGSACATLRKPEHPLHGGHAGRLNRGRRPSFPCQPRGEAT